MNLQISLTGSILMILSLMLVTGNSIQLGHFLDRFTSNEQMTWFIGQAYSSNTK